MIDDAMRVEVGKVQIPSAGMRIGGLPRAAAKAAKVLGRQRAAKAALFFGAAYG